MFGKFASKALWLALVLATFIVIFAACGGGTNGPGDGDSSSSRKVGGNSSAYVDTTAIAEHSITVTLNDRYDALKIDAFVEAREEAEITFDSVSVRLDGRKINTVDGCNSGNGLVVYQCQVNSYDIGKDYCDGAPHDICLTAYVRKERSPAFEDCESFTRTVSTCNPSSAAVPSSSSVAVVKSLAPILFGNSDTLTLNSQVGFRGVILSTATGVEIPSDADIYYDQPGTTQGKLKAGKSAVKIKTEFTRNYNGYLYTGSIYWGINENYDVISNNQNTTDFGLTDTWEPNVQTEGVQYNGETYYMIRTNPSAPAYDWDSGDYLILTRGTPVTNSSNNNRAVKILAWKVN